jgi:putative Mg2+ transporter-C (MgtC) family protein
VTAVHFLVVYCYTSLAHRILSEQAELHVEYTRGKGAVEKIMQMCTGRGYAIQELAVEQGEPTAEGESRAIHFQVSGRRGVEALLVAIGDVKGVVSARQSSAQHGRD